MRFCELMAYYDYKMSNICRELSVSRSTVKRWKEKDSIPFHKQCVIQVLTKNKLIADSTNTNTNTNNNTKD